VSRATRRGVGGFLVDCTREHDWSRPVPEAVERARRLPPDGVAAAAHYHRIVGCVMASIGGDPGVPRALLDELGPAARRASGHGLLAAVALRLVREALDDEVPWLVVKGPVLDSVLYARPRMRAYRDLDVLVHPYDLERAIMLLEGAGYRMVDRNWSLMLRSMAGEVHLEREGSAPVDLHWSLLFNETLRRTFPFDVADMFRRSRTVTVSGGPVRTLDDVDTLVYLAVHGAIEGGDRLVWLKDLDMAIRQQPSWDAVCERATEYRAELPVATMLDRAARTLDAPVPGEVVAALAPRGWRAATAAADRAFPAAASGGFGNPSTLLARSARADVAATTREVLHGVRQRASRLAQGRLRRLDVRFDADNQGSLLFSAGGDVDRETYFARVATR
jgi:hypothetical protein